MLGNQTRDVGVADNRKCIHGFKDSVLVIEYQSPHCILPEAFQFFGGTGEISSMPIVKWQIISSSECT